MIFRRLNPVRYQLRKDALRVLSQGHPWIFRNHLSTATDAFEDGQWLRLVDHANETVGFGIYEQAGLIGIRVLRTGRQAPTREWFQQRVEKALKKREALRNYSNGFRALHGENDGVPGVVVDIYDRYAVLQTYARGVDGLGRYLASFIAKKLQLAGVIWKVPSKRRSKKPDAKLRRLSGTLPGNAVIKEGKLKIVVPIVEGQKSGTFLDLRGLRKWLSAQDFSGKRVLNLFSYTGTLGLACEIAKAKEVWNVDISPGAIEFAEKHHTLNPKQHRWIKADIFTWFKLLPAKEKFDVIIVDPPSMAADTSQVASALRAYKTLYTLALEHLAPGGILAACCCTSRITRQKFKAEVDKVLSRNLKLIKDIAPEDDHPVGFTEGDYLKLLIYRASSTKR